MLGIGWTEMLVVGVVALIVIGPKELPAVMQKIGRFAGVVRRMGTDFQRELNKTTGLNEVKNLRNAITQPLKQTTDAIRKEFNAVGADGKVAPTGALKPADPKAESVVGEIHKAAGMATPAEPVKGAVAAGAAGVTAAAPAKAGAASATPSPAPSTAASSTSDTTTKPKPARKSPAKKATAKKSAAKKALAKKAAKKAAASTAEASSDKPKAARKRKPAAKKTA